MKVLYAVPGIMSKSRMGVKEMERRKNVLQSFAGPDTIVDIRDIPEGPESIESTYEEYLGIPNTIDMIVQAEKDGFDGVILGCYADPGLDGAREMVSIPVVGPGVTSMHYAAMLGHHFSVITIMDTVVPTIEEMALKAGCERKLASVRTVDIPVLELNERPELLKERAMEEARAAIKEDRADCIAFGCMTMAFSGMAKEMSEALGVPVISPPIAALKFLEGLIASGLSHSKKAFPTPPKLR